jgi:glycosyltransferase involved in cell wall biosynthesis
MKLLIITQKVNREDPVLGFFHDWIFKLSEKFQKVSVICLEKGEFNFTENVEVFSLGKESKRSKVKYIQNFFNLILGLNKEYDSVFVHMNQEYILLGGFIWKILGKKVYFWRNHSSGNFLTRISIWFSDKVFYTSQESFTAKYLTKAVKMPVGIDTGKFRDYESVKKMGSVLSLGRISPVKNIHTMLEAVKILEAKKVPLVFDIIGDPVNPEDLKYKEKLIEENQSLINKHVLNFYPAVPNYETPKIYSEHEIFINLTPSGSFDKTLLEAAACGCILVTANKSLAGEIDEKMVVGDRTPDNVAGMINFWLEASDQEKKIASKKLQEYVSKNHSLNVLVERLTKEITS